MNSAINITKRNGEIETFNLDKVHKVLEWATEGITNVSISEIEIRSNIQLYNKIPAADIHDLLIKSAAELISEQTPNYQYVAARLVNYKLRKEVYGDYEPDSFTNIIDKNIERGVYDKSIRNLFSQEELNDLGSYIKHDRDNNFTYAATQQLVGKYLVQDRSTKTIYETPQVAYMMIAATLFGSYPQDTRMKYIKRFYDAISNFYISLPTPIMAGVRTATRQFSSCVLIETSDSLDSINATASSVVRYISKKAGIGIGVGSIRAEGSKVGDGSVVHTGVIPFLKYFQSAVKSCSQGGVRGGAATVYYPVWHLEFEDLIVLKNNKGTEETRVRHMDYGVQFNKLMYERLLSGGDITLFSPHDVPGLLDSFYADQDEFKRLYEKYEADKSIRKKTMKAMDVFTAFLQERKDTGRIYLQNVDHANTHSSFIESKAPVRQSNLCSEIDLPTKPLESLDDPHGEISLCTLSAINWGLINDPSEFEEYCDLTVRALDALLDYQDYPVKAAEISTMDRRPLGVGIINLAYFLAKRGLKYDQDALATVDEYAEAWSYYLIKASADLAVEKGACLKSDETKYGMGITPNMTYKKDVDDLVPHSLRLDWGSLRNQLNMNGIRNSTLMALMPAECQSLYNDLKLKSGLDVTLGQIIEEYGNVNINNVHELGVPGQRFEFIKPLELADGSTAWECYYNGYQDVTEIIFEDGKSYKFTNNHLLLVERDGKNKWVQVKDLVEGDDIVEV